MKQISLSNEIQTACPDLCVLALSCQVKNTANDADLWELIHQEEALVREQVKLNEINKWLPIQATRQAYKKLGKDPNRNHFADVFYGNCLYIRLTPWLT